MTPKPKRAALYVRVSTTNRAIKNPNVFEQDPSVQELPLRQMAEQRGWSVVRVYSDRMSGASESRPGLTALMADARRGAFDVVVVFRFDRFARSVTRASSRRIPHSEYCLRLPTGGATLRPWERQ